ncbi:MAG: hypothetical protein R2825_22260 [Saprospiraceae bacterium]
MGRPQILCDVELSTVAPHDDFVVELSIRQVGPNTAVFFFVEKYSFTT